MSKRIKIAWVVTSVWVVLWTIMLCIGIESAKDLAFNEWGDFFAGVSAPLAFLWLVVGYFQQGEELSQNTEALKQQEKALMLQVKELNQSVEQQKELVSITREEVEISKVTLKRQAELERRRAQPDLRFSIGSSDGRRGNMLGQHGDVTNHGGSISNVSFEIDSQLELSLSNSKNIDSGARTGVQVRVPIELPKDYCSELIVNYVDSLGNNGSMNFNISKNRDGFIVIDATDVYA